MLSGLIKLKCWPWHKEDLVEHLITLRTSIHTVKHGGVSIILRVTLDHLLVSLSTAPSVTFGRWFRWLCHIPSIFNHDLMVLQLKDVLELIPNWYFSRMLSQTCFDSALISWYYLFRYVLAKSGVLQEQISLYWGHFNGKQFNPISLFRYFLMTGCPRTNLGVSQISSWCESLLL